MIEQLSSIPKGQIWQDYSACSEKDNELFFPNKAKSTTPAQAVCKDCPVQQYCVADGFDTHERLGIRAGKSMYAWRRMGRAAALHSLEDRFAKAA